MRSPAASAAAAIRLVMAASCPIPGLFPLCVSLSVLLDADDVRVAVHEEVHGEHREDARELRAPDPECDVHVREPPGIEQIQQSAI